MATVKTFLICVIGKINHSCLKRNECLEIDIAEVWSQNKNI